MSKTPKKSKTAAAGYAVPQSREEAAGFLRQIGEVNRAIARIEADMNDIIARAKSDAETAATPLRDQVRSLMDGLRTWCEANRSSLTDGGKRKFGDLGTGKIEWRQRPPRVVIRGVDEVLARIRTLGLPFIRTTEEIDKEAMLREPDKARLIQGVSIGSAGEDFSVTPFEASIDQGA